MPLSMDLPPQSHRQDGSKNAFASANLEDLGTQVSIGEAVIHSDVPSDYELARLVVHPLLAARCATFTSLRE